jgi:Bacterial RNA polymerase, alpha chain C terminal domain
MDELPEDHAIVDLATVPLDLAPQNKWFSTLYNDSRVDGLYFLSPCERSPKARWRLHFSRGLVRIYHDIGNYPEISVDDARVEARAKIASIEAQMVAPTDVECAAYDMALVALKEGDGARADVVHGFLRIAQVPQEMERQMIVQPRQLPPCGALLTPVDRLELSVRAHNALTLAEIKNVAHLLLCDDARLLRIENFGRKSLKEVRTVLAALLAKWNDVVESPPASLSAAIALQYKILAHLEEQTTIMRAGLAILERIERQNVTDED